MVGVTRSPNQRFSGYKFIFRTNGVNSSHMNECYKSCIFIEIYGLKLKDLIGNRFMNCLWCGSGLCSRPSFMRVVRRTVNCSVSKNIFNDDKHVSDTL